MNRVLTTLALALPLGGFGWTLQEPASAPNSGKCCTESTANAVSLASNEQPAASKLDLIKGLVGTWVEADENGNPTEEIVSVYRVTAGGSAVIETLFPGSDHEMISMYCMDGKDLILTHYCVLGNAPTYRGERTEDGFSWKCLGARNLEAHEGAHMHEGRTQLVDQDHIRGTWLQTENGKVSYEAAFNLVRVQS